MYCKEVHIDEFNLSLQELQSKLYSSRQKPNLLSNGFDSFAYQTSFIVYEGNRVLACANMFVNMHIAWNGTPYALVGNYECIDNLEASKQILSKITSFAKNVNIETILGPMNGSTWYNYRFSLTQGANSFFLEPIHKDYYLNQFKSFGFLIDKEYQSTIEEDFNFQSSSIDGVREKLQNDSVALRCFDKKSFESDLKGIYDVSLVAFQNNPYFYRLDWNDFLLKNKQTIPMLDEELFIIAYKKNTIVGYLFALEDFYSTTKKQAVLKTLAVIPDKKYSGLGYVLLQELYNNLNAKGYQSLIHAFMYMNNNVTRMTNKLGSKPLNDYILLRKDLSE